MIPSSRPRRCGAALRLSRIGFGLAAIVLSVAALPACDSARSDAGPLYSVDIPGGFIGCQATGAYGIAWNSRIGFALDTYYNQSRLALTVGSVRLLDPHNLVAHGGLVYEMYQDQHPLISATLWDKMGQGAPARQWAARRAIPGAVIAPGHGLPPGLLPSRHFNSWEVAVDVSAVKPGGGWALGEVVTYRAGGRRYTVTAETGIAIGSGHAEGGSIPEDGNCAAQDKAIGAAFNRLLKT
jgi:hypothetical protein